MFSIWCSTNKPDSSNSTECSLYNKTSLGRWQFVVYVSVDISDNVISKLSMCSMISTSHCSDDVLLQRENWIVNLIEWYKCDLVAKRSFNKWHPKLQWQFVGVDLVKYARDANAGLFYQSFLPIFAQIKNLGNFNICFTTLFFYKGLHLSLHAVKSAPDLIQETFLNSNKLTIYCCFCRTPVFQKKSKVSKWYQTQPLIELVFIVEGPNRLLVTILD